MTRAELVGAIDAAAANCEAAHARLQRATSEVGTAKAEWIKRQREYTAAIGAFLRTLPVDDREVVALRERLDRMTTELAILEGAAPGEPS